MENIINNDLTYVIFLLGYDTLIKKHLKNKNGDMFECDIAYSICIEIARQFIESEEIKSQKSIYDCLIDFLENGTKYNLKLEEKEV